MGIISIKIKSTIFKQIYKIKLHLIFKKNKTITNNKYSLLILETRKSKLTQYKTRLHSATFSLNKKLINKLLIF